MLKTPCLNVQLYPAFLPGRTARLARGASLCALLIGLTGCITTTPQKNADTPQQLSSLSPSAGAEGNNSLLRMANAMAAEGAYSAAIPVYRRAYQKNGDTGSLIGLGRALSAVGEYREATEIFKNSDDPRALRGLANAHAAMGHSAEALPILERALEKNPVDADLLNSLAVVLNSLGRHDDAVAAYERGLQIDPQHSQLRHNYGLSLALSGLDFPRALGLLKSGTTESTATAAQRQSLALAYSLSGDDTTAQKLLTIDQGLAEAESKLAYFQLIKALPTAERFNAVMAGNVQPKPDISRAAVRKYSPPEGEKITTAARIIAAATPVQPAPPVAAIAEPIPEPVMAETEASTTPANSESSIPARTEASGWTIQIASYRLASQLENGWTILKSRYADVLGNLSPSQAFIDFGNREKRPKGQFYRLLSGPMKNRSAAFEACRKLRARGAECMVHAPGAASSNKS